MEYRLFQKASGCVVDVFNHRHVLLTAAFVQTVAVHSNRPVMDAGHMWPVRCGSQKLASQTMYFLNRLMGWREFSRLADG